LNKVQAEKKKEKEIRKAMIPQDIRQRILIEIGKE
jgi:hypothetical protein